jgi:histidine triad (HIT) family protein
MNMILRMHNIKSAIINLKSKIFGGMTIFSKIIAGEIPSYKIAENEKFFAFLDIFPLREGHVLVVPKTETDKFFDLSDEYLSEMLVFAKPIAKAIERSFNCNRCGIEVVGLEVPHAHMHLIPISSANDLNFNQEKLKMTPEQMKKTQEKIISNL